MPARQCCTGVCATTILMAVGQQALMLVVSHVGSGAGWSKRARASRNRGAHQRSGPKIPGERRSGRLSGSFSPTKRKTFMSKVFAVGTVTKRPPKEQEGETMSKELRNAVQLYLDGEIEQFWWRKHKQ